MSYPSTFYMFNFFVIHRKQIQDLNWQRKNDQLAGGAKLREQESKYVIYRAYLLLVNVGLDSPLKHLCLSWQLGLPGQ